MRKKKPRHYKKRFPPHKRIPFDRGLFTHTARNLYDLVFSYGLGGCWMSNFTIQGKLGCCRRSVQYARQLLVKRQVIVTARTNPHTWIMWSRYHPAVENCKILLFPIRQSIDNPYYRLGCKSVEVQNPAPWGAKFAPNSDVRTLTGSYEKSIRKEAVSTDTGPAFERETSDDGTNFTRGSTPTPASPSGLTGTRLLKKQTEANLADSDLISTYADKSLNEPGIARFVKLYEKYKKTGHSNNWAIQQANIKAINFIPHKKKKHN